MLPGQHWARSFTVEAEDIDYLVNRLLENETPLSSRQLAEILVSKRLEAEAAKLEARFKNARIYNPSESYEVGQQLVFPVLDYRVAVITGIRPGDNQEYGAFNVAAVAFEDQTPPREFAIDLSVPHKLSTSADDTAFMTMGSATVEDVMTEYGDRITDIVENALQGEDGLVVVARKWFPADLILQPDDGHLNLAEAVLDINLGGPLHTHEILEQMGGLGTSSAIELQEFSLNFVMNQDRRFDEVGPTGEVMWYLSRMEPEEVQRTPELLRYTAFPYNHDDLSPESLQVEREIGDELSDFPPAPDGDEAVITLIYPHRRAGTLPINHKTQHIFPTARRTERVYMTLVDGQDEEEFIGWVVRKEKYVFGLGPLYRKYSLPIGAYVSVARMEHPGRVRVDFSAYRARTEWIRLITAKGDQLLFENSKRAIGADYDDLMILGVDNLAELDAAVRLIGGQRKSLAALLRMLIPGLSRLNPQGTAHFKTIYSALNVIRRCPPGPILAILEANPDFENVGGHYWKLNE
ncbi:MAG: hypothetical protein OHK0046_01080 [Anaerolineae bacterium]